MDITIPPPPLFSVISINDPRGYRCPSYISNNESDFVKVYLMMILFPRSVITLDQPQPYWYCVHPWFTHCCQLRRMVASIRPKWQVIFRSVRRLLLSNLASIIKVSRRNRIRMKVMAYNRNFASFIHKPDSELRSRSSNYSFIRR